MAGQDRCRADRRIKAVPGREKPRQLQLRRHPEARAPVSEVMEAGDEGRLRRFQKQMAGYKFLIIDELGLPPSKTSGAELLFELISQRHDHGATLIIRNLPYDE